MSGKPGVLEGLDSLTAVLGSSSVAASSKPKIGTLFDVPISKLIVEDQVRSNFDGIKELAKSIKAEGQRMPIEVALLPDNDSYLLITGERRYRALKEIGSDSARAILVEMPEDKKSKLTSQITENLQRQDLSALELSAAFVSLQHLGLKQRQIAELVSKSQTLVNRYLAIATFPDDLKDALANDVTKDLTLVTMLNQIHSLDPVVYGGLLKKLNEESLTRSETKKTLETLKNPVEKDSERPSKPLLDEKEIVAHHYSRKSVKTPPDQFKAKVAAALSDGTKVAGVLRIDLAVEDRDDMLWIETEDNKLVAVETKNIRIKQI